uniref:Uncharacterized protein n=1 Tax=Oryza glumipatula TaxID=40148 RepID=A0A0E0AZR7_9ORYZ
MIIQEGCPRSAQTRLRPRSPPSWTQGFRLAASLLPCLLAELEDASSVQIKHSSHYARMVALYTILCMVGEEANKK